MVTLIALTIHQGNAGRAQKATAAWLAGITDENLTVGTGWALTLISNLYVGTARTTRVVIGVSVYTTNRCELAVTRTRDAKTALTNLI